METTRTRVAANANVGSGLNRPVRSGFAAAVEVGFTATYRQHSAGMLAMLRQLVPAHVAEEITQEVFLAVLSSDSYDPGRGTQRAYLYGIGRHKALDWIRRRYAEEDRDRRCAARRNIDQSLEEALCAADEAAGVRRALEALGHDKRQAILLAYFGGLSYRKVALALNVPEGTIKTRIRDGLIQLRHDLRASAAPLGTPGECVHLR